MSALRLKQVDPRIEQQFGGLLGVELLTNARSVEAYRLDDAGVRFPGDPPTSDRSRPEIGGHRVIAGPVKVPEILREKLVADWLAPRHWLFNFSKGCYPHWDLAYRFAGPADELVVSFCFTCGQFTVHVNGNEIVRDIETYYHSLSSLMAARIVFPNDERLRSFRMG